MSSIIKSVSVTPDEESFLIDYNLSPTQLLKEKIWEMRGAIKKLVQNKIDKMVGVIEHQSSRIDYLTNVLEKEGVSFI